jgi:hypothetical protein
MSEPSYEYNSETSSIPFPKFRIEHKGVEKRWLPRSAIEWSEPLARTMMAFFVKCDYPYSNIERIPFLDPLRSEIRRFFLSLDAYMESSNPVLSDKDILYGSTRIDYALFLKRVKRKSFETTWYADNYSYPDWWNDVPSYRINDIGDIFNFSYLIFYKIDPGLIEDYKEGFIPVNVKKSTLNAFEEAVFNLLPDRSQFEVIDENEVLNQITSSVSLDMKGKKAFHYKIKSGNLEFSKKRGVSRRSIIQVSPENTRDSVIVPIEDLNTISLMDLQLNEILSKMKGHIHLRDKNESTKRLKSLAKNYTYYIQRDIKKEGITKPRELLTAMLRVLHERYPDIKIFSYTDFYAGYALELDSGEIVFPTRGHGLGMANSLTTLMQLGVHEVVMDRIMDDTAMEIDDVGIAVLNDDYVSAFKSDYHASEYWDTEDEVLEELSILREPTKSFRSLNRFVIAERYFNDETEYVKESYHRRELLLPMACYNIVHAKEYFSAAQLFTHNSYRNEYLERICNYWGYEFFPTEFEYPLLVGGWLNERTEGVDMSLVSLETLPYKSYVARGFNATGASVEKSGQGSRYVISDPPIIKLLNRPEYPEKYRQHLNHLTEFELNQKYGKNLNKSERNFKKYWDRLYKRRQERFKEQLDVPFDALIKMIVERCPTKVFYPIELMIDHYEVCDIYELPIYDFYKSENPIMSMLGKFNEHLNITFREEFSISFTNPDNFKTTGDLLNMDLQRSIKNDKVSVLFTNSHHSYSVPKGSYDPCQDYLNAFLIAQIANRISWGRGFPVIRPEFRSPILKLKEDVFGRIFSMKETIDICHYRLSREQILVYKDAKNVSECLSYAIRQISIEEPAPVECYSGIVLEDLEEVDRNRRLEYVSENPYGDFSDDPVEIKLEDLIKDFKTIFSIWRINKKAFIVNDPIIHDCLSLWGVAIMTASMEYFRDSIPEQRSMMDDLLRHSYSGFVENFLRREGIIEAFTPVDIFALSSDEDDDAGLFGGFFGQ